MNHTCHHPTCEKPVRPNMLACRTHWFQLPVALRNAVWKEYKLGQEIRKDPSPAYLEVVRQCKQYWLDH